MPKKKIKHKTCPILDKAGVDYAEAGWDSPNKNWIKDICRNCPYERCVFNGKKERR